MPRPRGALFSRRQPARGDIGTERAPALCVLTHRRTLATLAAVFAVAAGCSPDTRAGQNTADSAGGSAANATSGASTDADAVTPEATATQSTLRTLADRGEAVIEMARMGVTRKEQLQVSDDARRILDAGRKESNRLLATLKGEYRTTHKPRITEADQTTIDSLNGVGTGEFDRAFLGFVAQHYDDDAALIEKSLPTVSVKVRDALTEIRAQRLADAAAFRKRLATTRRSGR